MCEGEGVMLYNTISRNTDPLRKRVLIATVKIRILSSGSDARDRDLSSVASSDVRLSARYS